MAPKKLPLARPADAGFTPDRTQPQRDVFLAKIDQTVPWVAMCALIESCYGKAREHCTDRRPIGPERRLRIHFLQHRCALSALGVAEALCDSKTTRHFVGIDLDREGAADETTVPKFSHLMDRHSSTKAILATVNHPLVRGDVKMSRHPLAPLGDSRTLFGTRPAAFGRRPRPHVV